MIENVFVMLSHPPPIPDKNLGHAFEHEVATRTANRIGFHENSKSDLSKVA